MSALVRGRRWSTADGDLADSPDRKPGDFQFEDAGYQQTDDPKGATELQMIDTGRAWCRLTYACPRSGKPCGGIVIGFQDKPKVGPASWNWNGDLEHPTLHPSINCTGGCGWHGYLVSGEFREC